MPPLDTAFRTAAGYQRAATGGSTLKAIERAGSEGLNMIRAVILVDRQEGGLAAIAGHVADVKAIVTRDEPMAVFR